MPRSLLILALLSATAAQAQTGEAPGIPKDSISPETGLPYWAPGRGELDYDALRRRELSVLEAQFGAFQHGAEALAKVTVAHCAGDAPRPEVIAALRTARLAWAPLEAYQFGPLEQSGLALAINFWPDRKNFVGRALKELRSQPTEVQSDPAKIAARSAAVQGFPALEALLATDTPCPTAIGVSAHLAGLAQQAYDGWFAPEGWADLVRSAGPDNPVYLSPKEFTAEVYTALDFLLTRMKDQAITRPMGDATGPKPHRAEGWQLGLSNDILHAQLGGLEQMVINGFAGDVGNTRRAWIEDVIAQAHGRIDALGMPLHEAVADAEGSWRVEGLANKIAYLQTQMDMDIGPELGVETGFSPADGD